MFKKIAITLGIIIVIGIAVGIFADAAVIKGMINGVWEWIFKTLFNQTTVPNLGL